MAPAQSGAAAVSWMELVLPRLAHSVAMCAATHSCSWAILALASQCIREAVEMLRPAKLVFTVTKAGSWVALQQQNALAWVGGCDLAMRAVLAVLLALRLLSLQLQCSAQQPQREGQTAGRDVNVGGLKRRPTAQAGRHVRGERLSDGTARLTNTA